MSQPNQHTYRVGLTARQREAYDFIMKTSNENGVAPSYQEIADAMGLKSKSGVVKLVDILVARGYLYRGGKGCSRTLIAVEDADQSRGGKLTSYNLYPCPRCKSNAKIKGSMVFGHLKLMCSECGYYITSNRRSGDIEYLLHNEMIDRWNGE